MRISTDDDLRRIDSVFLGPKEFRFPWFWKYRTYILVSGSLLAFGALGIYLGVPINGFTVLGWLVGSYAFATRVVERRLIPGFGLWPLVKSVAQEIAAPRKDKPQPVVHEVGGRTPFRAEKKD